MTSRDKSRSSFTFTMWKIKANTNITKTFQSLVIRYRTDLSEVDKGRTWLGNKKYRINKIYRTVFKAK